MVHNKTYARIPWNKGLTMQDPRVAKNIEHSTRTIRQKVKNGTWKIAPSRKGEVPWNKGLTKETDERVEKYADSGRKTLLKLWENGSMLGMTGYEHTCESKKRNSDSHIGGIPWNKGKTLTTEQKKNCKGFPKGNIPWNKGTKGLMPVPWNKGKHPEYVQGENHPMYGEKHIEATLIKMSMQHKGQKSWNKGFTAETDERVAKGRENWLLAMQSKTEEEKREIIKKCLSIRSPNKKEMLLQSILNRLYPNEWKYVGDGSVVIDNKCPDFINCNGKKLIIELFGEYWHEKGEEELRRATFRNYGYETLVVWVRELSNENSLIQKIRDFTENKIMTEVCCA